MEQQQKLDLPDLTIASLASHISKCFTEAEQAKQPITERLIACERQRKGEYDPRTAIEITRVGAQPVFIKITDIKCRAADAWIKDVMQNHGESTWALNPSAEPELPQNLVTEVQQVVMQEASALATQGVVVEPETVEMRRNQLLEEAEKRVREIALQRCKRMEVRITDKLEEGGFRKALAELTYDFTTFPAAILKGPIFRKKKRMKWGADFTPIVTEEPVMEFERVSPHDIFPSPMAVSIQDGYLIQRHRLSRSDLRGMSTFKGADPVAIENILQRFRTGYQTNIAADSDRNHLADRTTHFGPDGLIEALEYWGPASGYMLKEWGLMSIGGETVKEREEYQINAWYVAGEIVRAVINPDPLGQRPYSKSCFEDKPGQFWGGALPEKMSDSQMLCNAAGRAIAMNMGIASGPQAEVTIDRLPSGAQVTNMYPWKIWQTTSDRTGGGQPAVRFFQPELNAAELMTIFNHFSKVADEVTGVPNYVYGSTAVGGAGRTASGLSMLMENAAKGIKHAIMNLDQSVTELIVRIYNHLMLHDPDQSIKGDMQVVASGAIGAMIREQQEIARREFMAATLNPMDAQIIGAAGRAHMLRETGKTVFPDIDKIVPDPVKMQAAMAAQQAQAQQMAMQQSPEAGGMPAGIPPEQQAPPVATVQ